VSFGILGGSVGLCLGLAGGLVRKSALWAIIGGATGLILGGAAGVGVTHLTLPMYFAHARANDVTYSLILHCAIWAAVGGAAGLAFGVGLGGWSRIVRCTVGGLGGAALAAVIYEFAGSVVPLAMTDRPVSRTWESRLLARLLVGVVVAAGAALLASQNGESGKRLR
jgi:hypothetical protein